MKIDINKRYFANEELKTKSKGMEMYYPFFNAITETFNITSNNSIADVGCRDAWLLYIFKENMPEINTTGFDYFEWMKESADKLIQNDIHIWDMRDDITNNENYNTWSNKHDIVISTEVGEHIDPEYANTYLQNISKLMKNDARLVMSWSEVGGDKHGQHLNPLTRSEFFSLMDENGFCLDDKNDIFVETCKRNNIASYYLDSSLTIWRKK